MDKNEISTYAKAVFEEVDDDGSGEISFEEFAGWIKNSSDLQSFLLRYTGKQSIEETIRQYKKMCKVFGDIFDTCAVNMMGQYIARVEDIK